MVSNKQCDNIVVVPSDFGTTRSIISFDFKPKKKKSCCAEWWRSIAKIVFDLFDLIRDVQGGLARQLPASPFDSTELYQEMMFGSSWRVTAVKNTDRNTPLVKLGTT